MAAAQPPLVGALLSGSLWAFRPQDLCKGLKESFPPMLAACAGQLFRKGSRLHPECRHRLSSWLAHHLSCFGLMWPWARWAHVAQQRPSAAQRRFVASALQKMARRPYSHPPPPRFALARPTST